MNERDHAIVVGISRYGSLRPELEGPERDAKAFKEWLLDPEGGDVPPANIRVVLSSDYDFKTGEDPSAFEPSLSRVTREFGRLMGVTKQNAEKGPRVGRRLYIYLAGHGLTPKIDPLSTKHFSALAMAGYVEDEHPEFLPALLYANWFEASDSFDEIVLFMDCCRDDRAEVQLTPLSLPIVPDGRVDAVRTFYAWATRWNSTAWEMPMGDSQEKRGVFSYALLEALKNGTPDEKGRITPAVVAGHIIRRVPELRNGDASQAPQFLPEKPDDGIVLRQMKLQTPTNVTVTFNPALTGQTADLLDSTLEHSLAAVQISAAPWPLSLRRGLHVIRVGASHTQFLVLRDGETKAVHVDG